jgi:hypothetical protein
VSLKKEPGQYHHRPIPHRPMPGNDELFSKLIQTLEIDINQTKK